MKRIALLTLLLAGAVLAVAGSVQKPNIVVFLVDDMGLMDTSVPFLVDKKGHPEKHPLKQGDR